MSLSKLLAPALAMLLVAMPAVYADDTDETPPESNDTGIMVDEPTDDAVDESTDSTQPATDEAKPEAPPEIAEQVDPAIKALQDYYAELYGKPLTQKNRLAKLVAVMSLSKIDAPQLTEKLLKAINEPDKIISQLAWEAVLARSESLTNEQRSMWTESGFKAADAGAFPGDTVAPVLEAAAQYPLNNTKLMIAQKLIERLCKESDPSTKEGKAALEAGGRALAAWSDPRLIRAIYPATLAKSKMFDRAVLLFGKLPNAPKEGGKKEWSDWYLSAKFVATPLQQLKPFNAPSLYFPKPEKILNPDPKWTQEAELPELKVSALRTVFCLDATGSGARLNEFVTGFIATLADCVDVAAESNQMGVVYYRHEIDPNMMVDCCKAAGRSPDDFRDYRLPVTSKIPELVHAMKETFLSTQKGHDSGGAAYIGALQRAREMVGAGRRDTISVVALFGDAKGTTGKEEFIPKVTEQLLKDNINVFFLPRDSRAERALADGIEVSKHDPIFYLDDIKLLQDDPNKMPIDFFEESSFGHLAMRILGCALPEQYYDRAEKIVYATTKILRAKDRAQKARASLEDQSPPEGN